MGDFILLTAANDLEFLGRQADHSRPVPIVQLVSYYITSKTVATVECRAWQPRTGGVIHYTYMHVSPVLQMFSVCYIGFVTWAAPLISYTQYNTSRVSQNFFYCSP